MNDATISLGIHDHTCIDSGLLVIQVVSLSDDSEEQVCIRGCFIIK